MTALFATPLDLKKNSVISGNLSEDKLNFVIKNAQIIHIQNYVGTDLYDELQVKALAGTLSAEQELLIDDYVNPMLVWWSLTEFVSVGAYTISNKGILKHTDETAETVSKAEIDALVLRYQKTAEYFTERLVRFLCDNSTDYPQYNTNSGSDINPEKSSTYGGLFLD
jgi:hypothetical protein